MATPPTRVLFAQPSSNWGTGTSKTTTAFDVQAGDLIVVYTYREAQNDGTAVTPSASGGSVTWTQRANQSGGNSTVAESICWTGAVGATATGITVSCNRPSTIDMNWGLTVELWRDHGGVGVAFSGNNGTGSGAPSVAATCSANSAVTCGVCDWNAADGTSRTWRTINGAAESESTYFRNSAAYANYQGYRTDTGAAGSITQGLTAPSTMRWVLTGVEILGTSGTTHNIAATGSGTTDGSVPLRVTMDLRSTGTGTTDGTAALTLNVLNITATGSGQTDGSVALGIVTPLSATGSGVTDGTAALRALLDLRATGTGATDGSVALTITAGGTTHSIASTGTGTTDGSVALVIHPPWPLTATGSGTTGGTADLRLHLGIVSVGTGTTGGDCFTRQTMHMRALGIVQSGGSVALRLTAQMTATGTGQTGGSVSLTLPILRITTTGHSYSGGSVVLSEPLYRFSPPTHREPYRSSTRPLVYHTLDYAKTIVKVNGLYVSIKTPDPSLLEGLTEGVDWFRGGCEYEVTRSVYDLLEASGFSVTIPGYGLGAYGFGPYGD